MINSAVNLIDELKPKVVLFNALYNKRDSYTQKPIVHPCKFILQAGQEEPKESEALFDSEARQFFPQSSPPLKIVSTIVDADGEKLIKDIYSFLKTALIEDDEQKIAAWLAAGGDAKQCLPAQFAPAVRLYGRIIAGDEHSLLATACIQGKEKIAQLLLEQQRPDVAQLQRLLFLAVKYGQIAMAKLLFEKGAIINQLSETYEKVSPLFEAVNYDQPDMVKWLLDNGAEVDQYQGGSGCAGLTALYRAVSRRSVAVVQLLIQYGADVNKPQGKGTDRGLPPLFNAIWCGKPEMVELLVENGADIFDSKLDNLIQLKEEKFLLPGEGAAREMARSKRKQVKAMISLLASMTLRLETRKPTIALKKLEEVETLISQLFKNWPAIIRMNHTLEEISTRLAQTDLSGDAINKVITELCKPVVPIVSESATSDCKPLLYLATLKRDQPQAAPAVEQSQRDLGTTARL